jgi:hypothetical protein
MHGKESPTPEAPLSAPDKEVVRLPDGRELTYYRFPEPAADAPARPPAPGGER